jgi:hypothetical protein
MSLLVKTLVPALLVFGALATQVPSLAGGHLSASLPAGGSSGPAPFAFTLSDAGVSGPELNVGVDGDGRIFVGGWDAIARSDDGGASWTQHRTPIGLAADRVLVVDKQTNRVFVDDTTLGCTILSYSDTHGDDWLVNPAACGGGVTDHQKVAVGKRTALADPTGLLYPNVVYVCANGLSHTDCGVSVDGGATFLPGGVHNVGCAFQGAPVTDLDGVLYEPQSQCGLSVSVSADNGQNWAEHDLPATFPSSSDAPSLAVTPDGTLYLFYTDDQWKPAFARSSDGGSSWDGPFAVPVAGLTSSLFPVVVGGADGRIALAFYGTTDDGTGWDHNPGNAPASAAWHGYVAIVTDAGAAAPTVAPVQVTPSGDPLQYGCLSKLGGCLNNIADYAGIDVAPDGSVVAVFIDGCLPGCTGASQSTSDEALVAIQDSGPLLH